MYTVLPFRADSELAKIMTNQWLEADGKRLKQLREQAGLDPVVLAKNVAISPSMLKQLEDGGSSAFYSPTIKFHTGRRLLKLFGSDVSNPPEAEDMLAPTLSPDEKEKIVKTATEIIRVSHTSIKKPLLEDLYELVREMLASNRSLFITLCVGAVLIIGILIKHTTISETAAEAALQKEAVDVELPPTRLGLSNTELTAKSEVKSASSTLPASSEKPIDVALSVASSAPVAIPNSCKWTAGLTPTTSPNPTKSGSYVYLIAAKDVSFCVMDQSKVVTEYQMKANTEKNIRGIPPFHFYSSELKMIKFFYQGSRIMTEHQSELLLAEVPLVVR